MQASCRAAIATSVAMLLVGRTTAQPLPDEISSLPWAVDGEVYVSARVGDVVYLGGSFSAVAPRSQLIGGFGVFSAANAELMAAEPSGSTAGQVVDDGAGGWIVVQGLELRRLDGFGRRTAWAVPFRGAGFSQIHDLARFGSTLFVGGSFTTVGGAPRKLLAAIDIPTGAVLPFDLGIVGDAVYALHVSGADLYVGGSFTSVGGMGRADIARVDAVTGAVASWAPTLGASSSVHAIATAAGRVFFGGTFTTVNGQPRSSFAAVDSSGALLSFAPNPVGTGGGQSFVTSIAVAGDTAYIGGGFTEASGVARPGVLALDLTSGAVLPWAPLTAGFVSALATVPDGVLIGGLNLTTPTNPAARQVIKAGFVTAATLPWQPGVGAYVLDIEVVGDRVALAGYFSTHRATPARSLVGFNVVTGALVAMPGVDGFVGALATRGSILFVGGFFTKIGVEPRSNLGAIETDTGQVLPFAPSLVSTSVFPQVTALNVVANALYVGGGFDLANGLPRVSLAALDATSGATLSWTPGALAGDSSRGVSSIAVASGRVWFGGRFTAVGGVARSGMAVVSEASGALDPLDLAPSGVVERLVVVGPHLYASGGFVRMAGLARVGHARIEHASGTVDAWVGPAAASELSFNGTDVYAAGLFSPPQVRLALFRPATVSSPLLVPTAWAPQEGSAYHVAAFSDGALGMGNAFNGPTSPFFYRNRAPGGAPDAVVGFGVHLQGDLMTMRWTPSLTGALPTSYRLLAGSRPGAADLADVVLGRTPAFAATVPAGRYFVRLVPYADGMAGPASPEIGFVSGAAGCTTVPGAPVLTVSAASPPVLQWTAGAGVTPTGYELRAGTMPGVHTLAQLSLGTTPAAFSTAGAPPGTYYAVVAATNACGVSVVSNEVQVVVPAPAPPAPPSGLAAQVVGAMVTLSWTPPAGTVAGYRVEAGTAPGLANLVSGFPVGTALFRATNVPPGRYFVRVRAENGGLVSAPSNEVVVDVP